MANPYFNATYYLTNNPDVFAAGINTVEGAWNHYVNHGAAESLAGATSRQPAPWFDAVYYLQNNADLSTAGLTAGQLFDHFTTFGIGESRAPSANAVLTEANLLAYAKGNADLLEAFKIDPAATTLTAKEQADLANHFYQHGYKEDRANAPFDADVDPGKVGQTFALTAAIDNFNVGNGKATNGDDIFLGDNSGTATVHLADTIDGGEGRDTLKVYGGNVVPNFSNIEVVYYNAAGGNVDLSGKAGVEEVQLDNFGANTITLANGQKLAVMNQTAATTVAGNSVTSLDLTVNKVGTANTAQNVLLNGTALTTVNLTASGGASNIGLQNAGARLATLNVAGDQVVTVNGDTGTSDPALTTVDASAMTAGGLRLKVDDTDRNMTITGGKGNDRIDMQDTLTINDKVDGGEGTDTLRLGAAADSAAATNVKNFEVFEATKGGETHNLDVFKANNAFASVGSNVTAANITINNIGDAAVGNIFLTGDAPGTVTLTAKNFVSGGTSDAATVKLDNSVTKHANGVDVTQLDFANVDILTIESISDGSPVAGEQNSIGTLTATDLEKLIFTGDQSVSVTLDSTTAGLTEVDGTKLTAALVIDTDAAAIASILVKGSAKADTIEIDNAATLSSTVYTGGGSDTVHFAGKGASNATHTMKFTATEFNAGDVKAGDALTVNFKDVAAAAGDRVIIDFGTEIEALMKVGGVNLGTTAANVNVLGATLGATTNVAATLTNAGGGAPDVVTFQIDLNGDGRYVASEDYQVAITLTGLATGNSTLVYDATNDYFLLTGV